MKKASALTAALTVALTFATVVGAEPNAPAGVAQAATSQATVTGKTPPAPVPKTGQTTSFAKGDDGDLRVGVAWPKPRLTDNNDGTVTDNLTGLIWLKKADLHSTDWATALQDMAQLNTDGTMNGNSAGDTSNGGRHQTDWRLPNVRELSSLMDYGQPSGLPSGHPFSGYKPRFYWSSTTVPKGITPLAFNDQKPATTHAYMVNPSEKVFYAPNTGHT